MNKKGHSIRCCDLFIENALLAKFKNKGSFQIAAAENYINFNHS